MLAHHQGGLLNASDLARALTVSTQSVTRYIDLLVDLLLVRRLRPYHANVAKRLVKSPKVYVRDSGWFMRCSAFKRWTDWPVIPSSGQVGKGLCWKPCWRPCPGAAKPFFIARRSGAEIDLVIERPDGTLSAVEIKRGLAAKLGRGFYQAYEDLKPARAFVVPCR